MTRRIEDPTAAARHLADQARHAEQTRKAAAAARNAPVSRAAKKLKADEFSTGRGRALRVKELALGSAPMPLLPSAPRPSAPECPAVPPQPATPAERANADAERIKQTAKTNPQAAAEQLEQALANPDPAYREALLSQVTAIVETISGSLGRADARAFGPTMTALGGAALAAGPEGARAMGEAFATAVKGRLGGFDNLGLPSGPGSMAFFEAMMTTPGMGDFVMGMVEGAKASGNFALLKDLGSLVVLTTRMATGAFEDAQQTVDRLNAELNALIEGFGPGDEAQLQAAVEAFKERHADEYEALERAGAAMTNVLAVAGPLLTSGGDLDADFAIPLMRALQLAPQVLATSAGQEALRSALDAQARGEASPLLDTVTRLSEGSDELRDQLAPLVSQALGSRIAELQADGQTDAAHALIDSLGSLADVFGVPVDELENLQRAFHDSLDGKPGALESLEAAMGAVGPFLPEGSTAAASLKGLGFVIGVAGLGRSFEGFTDAQLHEQVATLASTLGLGVDGASLAVRVFGSPGTQKSLERLFGKASAVTGVIGAMASVIDFGQAAESGNLGDMAVTGLNAASSILLLIPGGQIAGVGLALASFALDAFLGARRQREAEHASEADAQAFLEAAGLDTDFAEVFANLDNHKRNIGTFVEQVAEELGLTIDEFYERLNESSGADRERLLERFAMLSGVGELLGGQLPIFGPPVTIEMLGDLPDGISYEAAAELVRRINERRAEIVEQVATEIRPLLE